MNVFICDDEKYFIEEIKILLENYFIKNKTKFKIYTFTCGEDLLKSDIYPDIAFLDVEIINHKSGTYIGKDLLEKYPDVKIFIVTSFFEYVNECFRFSFFRFLTKPVNKLILYENLDDAMYQKNIERKEVIIETNNNVYSIYALEIIMIEAYKKGTKIYTLGDEIQCHYTVSFFEKFLDSSCFFKTHRKYIVGLKHIVKFDRQNVWLKNISEPAYLSLAQYKQFKKKFLWYKERML